MRAFSTVGTLEKQMRQFRCPCCDSILQEGPKMVYDTLAECLLTKKKEPTFRGTLICPSVLCRAHHGFWSTVEGCFYKNPADRNPQQLYDDRFAAFLRWCRDDSEKVCTDEGLGPELGRRLRQLASNPVSTAALKIAFAEGWHSTWPLREGDPSKPVPPDLPTHGCTAGKDIRF